MGLLRLKKIKKKVPFSKETITKIIKKYGTPVHVYDELGMINAAKRLNKAFSWNKGFKNYYALKACPNHHILNVLKQQGNGADCSSEPELLLAEKSGMRGEDIIFSSNNTPPHEFVLAHKLGAYINLDDFEHLKVLAELKIVPETIFLRYNSGNIFLGNSIIGEPEEAKFGMTKQQLMEAYSIMKNRGTKKFGLHTMISSNELDEEHFIRVAKMLFELVLEIKKETGIIISYINMGGGLGIPYMPESSEINIEYVSKKIKKYYEELIQKNNLAITLFMECGRYITGPHGYLITRVRQVTNKYKTFVGVDASMSNLMRPGMYGSYHHITVLGKEKQKPTNTYDVTGSLCENNDKFAINRKLPEIKRNNIIIMHDTGAHGHAMGFTYNGKLRSAEVLVTRNKNLKLIRRAETNEDYFATLVE